MAQAFPNTHSFFAVSSGLLSRALNLLFLLPPRG